MRLIAPGCLLVCASTLCGWAGAIFAATPQVVVSNTNNVVNGCTTSPSCLIGNPGPDGISLREAITAVNNVSGPYTITFASSLAGKTITLQQRYPPIVQNNVTITGLTKKSGQPNLTIDASHASGAGSTFFIAGSQFSISDLRFTYTPASAAVIQIGGAGYSLTGQLINSPPKITTFQINGNTFSATTPSNASAAIFVSTSLNLTSHSAISDVVISNNTFSGQFEAVDVQAGGTSNVIENITIWNNSFSQMKSNGTSAVEIDAEQTDNVVKDVVIAQNTFTDNFQGVVLDIGGQSTGNSIQSVTIERNSFSGNLGAMGVVAGVNSNTDNNTVSNTQIVDNVINLTGYQNQGAATVQIIDSQSGGTNDKVSGVTLVNNTINNGTSASPPGWGVWVTSSGGVSGVKIENTIFWGNQTNPPLKGITSSAEVSHSIINQPGFTGTNRNINANPLFVNAAQGKFDLQSKSPAIGAGTSSGAPSIDIDCQKFGKPPSISAYQLQGPDICSTTAPPAAPQAVSRR